ncbi:MAG TPA: GNAT family N-acetyltransferase [Oscillatoriales cyanobacterium M59_W2019_021]|nr:MAG: GNAT family N-acetyltransferase [Cyanobacteria bacterium J055]HIK30584.1 GNAT family N-acetyltransferase [Oscillatoriales cyanobacterium M4454_W2019_049]HIK50529.1 GNAT family N-acetyltransferase [Oscillatoriales cyanobacterium M59_W2019_021]
MTHTLKYQHWTIRDWEPRDRQAVSQLIGSVLGEYGLGWDPRGADRDVVEVERFYRATGGEFWVVEDRDEIVGTSGYYPVERGNKAVEIRKMYLLPSVRGRGLGRFLLDRLERSIAAGGFQTIWIETASVLVEAIQLYESSGYQASTGVETARCDRIYVKILQ